MPERFLVLGKDPQGKSCRVGRDHFTWSYAFTGERSGGILPYCGWRKSDGITKDPLQIDILNDGLGMVNTYAKEINGQNNHQNNVLHCNENSCELVLGDGTKRRYQRVQKLPSSILGEELIPLLAEKVIEPEYFLLIQETFPSGSHLFFSYDSEGHLTSVEMKNCKQDKILSWVHFVYEFQENGCFVKVETSDEKVLEYHFKQAHETYQLSEVKGSHLIPVSYDYQAEDGRFFLTKKCLPQGRFLEVEYEAGKVKALKSPRSEKIYSFFKENLRKKRLLDIPDLKNMLMTFPEKRFPQKAIFSLKN